MTTTSRRAASTWSGRIGRVRDWGARPPGGGATPGSRERLLLLAGFVLLVVLRLPQAWLHGRFLDEEGTIFFAYGWHRPAGAALFRSFAGYLNLSANATTLLAVRLVRAGVLPLEAAPYATMTTALLFQLLPAVLILTGRAPWLTSRWALVASLLIVAGAPMTEEVFVNVLHVQFHLALCAGLILALDVPRSRAGRLGHGTLLFLAPLCGPGAIVLLPLFTLRSLADRDAARLAQTAMFAAGAAIQLLLFFSRSPVRGQLLDPATLGAILFVRLVLLPFLGAPLANAAGAQIHLSRLAGGIGWWSAVAGAAVYFGALIVLALRRREDAAIWLIVSGLGIAAVSFGGGMIATDPRDWFSVGAAERYNFLPLVLTTWGLVALAMRTTGITSIICAALCTLTLISGARVYATPLTELSQGPVWADEVAAWRRDHDHPLAAWPGNWWVDLSDRDRPCSPLRLAGSARADPSYCESVWLARVARPVATNVDGQR